VLDEAKYIPDLRIRKAFIEWITNGEPGFEWAMGNELQNVKAADFNYVEDHHEVYASFTKALDEAVSKKVVRPKVTPNVSKTTFSSITLPVLNSLRSNPSPSGIVSLPSSPLVVSHSMSRNPLSSVGAHLKTRPSLLELWESRSKNKK